jgi:drug/metabolite transporter (DMT)-like permease
VVVGLVLVLLPDGAAAWSSLPANVAGNPPAYGLALVAAVTWALYSNLTRRLAGAGNASGVLLFLPVTGVVLVGLSLILPEEGAWTTRAMIEAGLLGTATISAYLLWDLAMRKGDVVLVAAGSYLTPLFATLVGCAYLAVLPPTSLWIGCLLLVVGSLASWRAVSDRD